MYIVEWINTEGAHDCFVFEHLSVAAKQAALLVWYGCSNIVIRSISEHSITIEQFGGPVYV